MLLPRRVLFTGRPGEFRYRSTTAMGLSATKWAERAPWLPSRPDTCPAGAREPAAVWLDNEVFSAAGQGICAVQVSTAHNLRGCLPGAGARVGDLPARRAESFPPLRRAWGFSSESAVRPLGRRRPEDLIICPGSDPEPDRHKDAIGVAHRGVRVPIYGRRRSACSSRRLRQTNWRAPRAT